VFGEWHLAKNASGGICLASNTEMIDDSPPLTDAQRRQVLAEWNNTSTEYPRDKCVHELFEAHVANTPDAVAVVFDKQQLTYSELNAKANQLAHHLRSKGVGPEVLVGLCIERSLDLIVGILGILKAGGAYVPLDADYPLQLLKFMIEDAGIKLLVTTSDLVPRLPVRLADAVCVDLARDSIAANSRANPAHIATSQNRAYVMYTSGSTGKPKGVEVQHNSIVRLVIATNYATLRSSDVFLQLSPISFDASTFEIWGALLNGAKLVIAATGPLDFTALTCVIKSYSVTILFLTTALFNQAVEQCPEMLEDVEQVLFGGEKVSVRHVAMAQRKLGPKVKLTNCYGPTENTTFTTYYPITSVVNEATTTIPIGRPIANTQVFVLDDNRRLVPIGAFGELYVGGDGLARGYLNRPELTAERFVDNPFDPDPSSRLYRTGDQVRWLPDGNLDFQGRLDSQVKLRGFRIELAEVEAALLDHASVAHCAVVAREDPPISKRLVAYWVSRRGDQPVDLRQHLSERLPEHMIPSAFVRLDSLPLSPSGKVDRRALPAPEQNRADLKVGYVEPQNAIQRSLVKIWTEVLGIKQIGINDSFFALGGHSLLAAQLCLQIEKTMSRRVPLSQFFAAPTILRLAEAIEGEPLAQSGVVVVSVQTTGKREPLYLMPSINGSPISWRGLPEMLDAELPIFSVGLAGDVAPWGDQATLQDIASYYAAALRDAHPVGPLHLLGHSFGGMLAYEVACQLRQSGAEVGLVLVADTGPEQLRPSTPWIVLRNLPTLLAALPLWTRQFIFQTTAKEKLYELARKLRVWKCAVASKLKGGPVVQRLEEALDTRKVPADMKRRMETNFNAFQFYNPGSYAGRLVLFRATIRPLLNGFIPDFGWEHCVSGGIEIIDVPGDHMSMLEPPNSNVLAAKLQAVLNRG
jgi:amino acid adenylation domain-containing protein